MWCILLCWDQLVQLHGSIVLIARLTALDKFLKLQCPSTELLNKSRFHELRQLGWNLGVPLTLLARLLNFIYQSAAYTGLLRLAQSLFKLIQAFVGKLSRILVTYFIQMKRLELLTFLDDAWVNDWGNLRRIKNLLLHLRLQSRQLVTFIWLIGLAAF